MRRCGQARPELTQKPSSDRDLLRADLFLKVESGGVCRLLGEYLAEYFTCFRKPCGFDEAARERDPQVVGVRRSYASAKEFDRRVGVAQLPCRLGSDGVVAGDR